MFRKFLKLIGYTLIFSIIGGGTILGIGELNLAIAQNLDDSGVVYPVKELGNCADKQACKIYCDQTENQEKCLDFAESNGLMKKQDVEKAKKVLKLMQEGTSTPGGCKNEQECEGYCDDLIHLDECVTFAEKAGLISPEEIKMVKATGGKGPGGCKGKKACDAYCESEANLDECISFASRHGLMSAQEAEMVKKTKGKGPGGCSSKESCDAYCQQEANFESCLEFGHQYGMMSDEEYEMAKKMGPKMMNQGGPGGCKNKQECDAFCGDEKNFETCIEFGHQNGMMSDSEYETAKKMGPRAMRGGPGGCKGKEECETFCNKPENAQECLQFAVESGMMSQEEADKMKERGFMAPPQDALGPNGEFMGPGGCKTQEECMAFCSDDQNKNVCAMFGAGPPPGQGQEDFQQGQASPNQMMPAGMTGPGGCDSPTACMRFCSETANQETCMNFVPPPPPPGQGMEQAPRIEPGQPMPGGSFAPGIQEPGAYPSPPPEGWRPPEGSQYQPPVGQEGMQPPAEMQPPPEIIPPESGSQYLPPPPGGEVPGQQPPVQVAPPSAEPAPQPQASRVIRLVNSLVNFLTAAISSLFGK